MTNNSYQESVLEDNDCPFLEDFHCKEEKQYDSDLEREEDGWPGTENPMVSDVGFARTVFHWIGIVGIHGRVGLSKFFSNLSVCYTHCSCGT